ncbi:uncharacterized protein LOC130054958 [Ostrea edulis]|uniref:uncharacterized protein LOC130054958 n=1 Tax=Ostrea edulis TaxID=37623 RepID=UPI0024AEB482|nr:uncharacterized protein LOC130054958 [Ostrea edulis]
MASASEISVQLRESLKNGTLTLRDLDNKKRGSSRSKRRRGKKEDKGTASNVRDSGSAGQELLTQEGAQEMRKNCRRSSKYPKRSIELKNSDISDSQNSQDAEMIVCSLLDVIIDEAYRHCAAIEHSITKDHADALVVGLMSAFNETTIVKCKALQQQTRQIQELMLSAAEETLADLFIIAAHGGLPV